MRVTRVKCIEKNIYIPRLLNLLCGVTQKSNTFVFEFSATRSSTGDILYRAPLKSENDGKVRERRKEEEDEEKKDISAVIRQASVAVKQREPSE